jgi:hypothetical protein
MERPAERASERASERDTATSRRMNSPWHFGSSEGVKQDDSGQCRDQGSKPPPLVVRPQFRTWKVGPAHGKFRSWADVAWCGCWLFAPPLWPLV